MNSHENSFSLFWMMWAGQLLSKIGSGISAFALGVYLLQETGSTSAYSSLLIAAFLPSVLLAPAGGVMADRKDRRLMMAAGDIGSAAGICFVILMFLLNPNRHWPIYLGVGLSSVFAALQSPAFKASVTDILDESVYAKASGLIQLAEASKFFIAPFIAGFLLTRFSIPAVLGVDVATFLLAALSVILIRKRMAVPPKESTEKDFQKSFTEGIRYLVGNDPVRRLLWLTIGITFLTGFLQSLFVPIVLSFTDTVTLGAVQSVSAFGMLAGSLMVGIYSKSDAARQVLSISLAAAGLFYTMIGATPHLLTITVTAFCFFFTLPFVNSSLEVLFRRNIANDMQGRTWSLISLISQSGMVIAVGSAGPLADCFFNPLLTETGGLSKTVGSLIGTGASRGSGLMVMIAGLLLLTYALLNVKAEKKPNTITDLFV